MDQFKTDVTRLTANDSGSRDPHGCQLAVIHTYECPRADDLEARAAWQETGGGDENRKGSYNILVGTRRTLRANDDNYIPWAAMPTGNRRGLHLSFLAYAQSSRQEWLDNMNQLDLGARVVADWCTRYGIPPVKVSPDEIRAGKRGVCGHADVSAAWRESDHTDPGAGFPWDVFLDRVKHFMNPAPQSKETDMSQEILNRLTDQDRKLNLILDQLAGPGGNFAGWPQLGGRTLVDAVAAIAEVEGVTGTRDTKEG